MSRKWINLGSEPGNLGDGDTLRAAFTKTQQNFSELYTSEFVTNAAIEDHSDATLEGTIAHALSQAEQQGGGTVVIGPGVYNCYNSLYIGTNVRLVGSGRDTTTILAQHTYDAITMGSGIYSLFAKPGIEHITIQLPESSAANAIKGRSRECGNGYIQHVIITGGGPESWGITLDSCNQFSIFGLAYQGGGNGIRWTNFINWGANYGDSLISAVDIDLVNTGTTGILLLGNTNGIVNNILLNRVEIKSKSGVQPGTTGIELNQVSRITLVNVDIENTDIGFINGPRSLSCAFINCYAIGCNNDYIEQAQTTKTTIIGGHGDFSDDQRLPSRNFRLYEPVFDEYTRVTSGVSDIVAYNDTATPKYLTISDAGSTIFTNNGASGSVAFILPNAPNTKSLEYNFSVVSPYTVEIHTENSSDRIRGFDGSLDYTDEGGYIFSSTPGTSITLRNVSNTWWIAEKLTGTWEILP